MLRVAEHSGSTCTNVPYMDASDINRVEMVDLSDKSTVTLSDKSVKVVRRMIEMQSWIRSLKERVFCLGRGLTIRW